MTSNWRVYFSSGARLSWARIDGGDRPFTVLGSITAPDNVQYGVADPAGRYLYVATSDGGPGLPAGVRNHLGCWAIDAVTGALAPHGAPRPLPSRPLHLSMTGDGRHLLLAFHQPAALAAHAIEADGTVGPPLRQRQPIDAGVFPHQIRATPGDRTVLVCARGTQAQAGALLTFDYHDGQFSPRARQSPPAGLGPRGLAWHPNGRWLYVAFELGNQLGQFALEKGAICAPAEYLVSTLAHADRCRPGPAQRAGAVLVHPDGHALYVSNRADQTALVDGAPVFIGGENNIAVFALDRATGRPRLLQHIATDRIEARTIAISPDGKWLMVGNQTSLLVDARDGGPARQVTAGLTLFAIHDDGRLTCAGQFDCPADVPLVWSAFVPGQHNA